MPCGSGKNRGSRSNRPLSREREGVSINSLVSAIIAEAIGAKRGSILFEFLMEAALLCVIGGAFGLLFVWLLSFVLTNAFKFPVFISIPMLIASIIICILVGIIAGIIPARRAAKMDAVVAIRSK